MSDRSGLPQGDAEDLLAQLWNENDDARARDLDRQIDALGLTPEEYTRAFLRMRNKQPGRMFHITPDGTVTVLGTGGEDA
jgi:hypothetical protein